VTELENLTVEFCLKCSREMQIGQNPLGLNPHNAMVRTRPLSATQIEMHPKSGRSQKIPLGVFFARKKS